jgi:hypothetical protein
MTLTRRTALAEPAMLALPAAVLASPPPPPAVRQAERHALALGAALTDLTRRTGAHGWVLHLTEAWGPDLRRNSAFAGWGGLLSFTEAAPVAGRRFFSESQPADLALRDGALSIRWS